MIVTTSVCLFVLLGDIKIIEQIYCLTGMAFSKEQNIFLKSARFSINQSLPLTVLCIYFLTFPNSRSNERYGN